MGQVKWVVLKRYKGIRYHENAQGERVYHITYRDGPRVRWERAGDSLEGRGRVAPTRK